MPGIPRLLIERIGEDLYYGSIGKPGPSPSTIKRRERIKKEMVKNEET
jgi:hypothetical protein